MAPNQDILSMLPETLQIAILSILPLKDEVTTSILAKHWRNLWRFRPNIEIDERHFPPSYHENQTQLETLTRQFSCIFFARTWLLLPYNDFPPNLSSFTLTFSNPMHWQFDTEFYIKCALARRTKSLELDFSSLDWGTRLLPINDSGTYSERFTLPHFVYQYRELESLKLVSCHFRVDRFMNLGCALKCVTLGWIEINESKLKKLIRNCPVLEGLSLIKCFKSTVYVIISKSLKRLRVDKCVDLLNLSVIAPNLESFMYCGDVVTFGMNEFPSIQNVDLDFGLVEFFDMDKGDDIVDLLSSVYFAKSLRVCAYVTQILPLVLDSRRLAGRPRVKELVMQTSFHENEFGGIFCLLNSYPFLEKVCFEIGQQNIFHEDNGAPVLRTGCVQKALKVVEIKGFKGTENEVYVLKLLLENGQVLHKLILRVPEFDQNAKTKAIKLRDIILARLSHLQVVII